MMNNTDIPLVSIGIPTYNRPKGLRRTLECITNQTYPYIEVIISDNNSTDGETIDICREYANKDKRISFYSQLSNIGPIQNFGFVLKHAKGEYFMWAADDDAWECNFIETCLNIHKRSPTYSMAFTNIVNIDEKGKVVRNYPSFRRFVSHSLFYSSCKFILSHEYEGKANLFYSLYKRKDLIKNFESMKYFSNWGADMVFVLKNMQDSGLCIDERVLFKKGTDSSFVTRDLNLTKLTKAEYIKSYAVPFEYYQCFVKNIYSYKYSFMYIIIMSLRFLFSQMLSLTRRLSS